MISRKLIEEIEAVTPSWGEGNERLPKLATPLDEVDEASVKTIGLTFDPRWGRFNGTTIRDRVLAMMREHVVMPQREVVARVWRVVGNEGVSPNGLRRQVKVALLQLEELRLVRRSQPPRGVERLRADEAWWELVS